MANQEDIDRANGDKDDDAKLRVAIRREFEGERTAILRDLARDLKELERPREWKSKKIIPYIAALAAAVVPVSTAINGYFEIQLKKKELDNTIALEWIEKAINPERGVEYRAGAFKVLKIVLRGSPLEEWLESESQVVRAVGKELQIRRKETANFVKTLDQAKLDSLATALGAKTGGEALIAILTAISRASRARDFDVIAQQINVLFDKEF